MTDAKPDRSRGTGIFFTRSDFRLRDFSINLETGESTVTPEIRTDTFHRWLRIAGEMSAQADRDRLVVYDAPDGEPFAAAIEAEFRSSIVAPSAAAFALDAFFGSVVHHAPDARVKTDKGRAATLMETFKRAFTLTAAQQKEMHEPMRQVFKFRGQAVHPPEEFASPTPHPVFGLQMEPRLVIFSAENAARAHDFAHRVIWICLDRPNSKLSKLTTWCDATKNLISEPPTAPPSSAGY